MNENNITLPSNKKFGSFFSLIFLCLFIYFFWNKFFWIYTLFFAILGIIFVILTIFAPYFLSRLNLAWFKFGIFLGRVFSPVVLGLIFFGLITPIAVIGRLVGRDILLLKKRNVKSYWVNRDQIMHDKDSYTNQF